MSAFDAISQSETLVDLAHRTQTEGYIHTDGKTDVPPLEEENAFHAGLARIMVCYDDLVAVNASTPEPGSHEFSPENLSIALGEALRVVTSTPSSLDLLLSLREKEASDILESIQTFLNFSPTSHPFRLSATHLIVKLADKSGQMPPSLLVEDVIFDDNRQHHRQGGFADVYMGWKAGESVAIKKPRIVNSGTEEAHKRLCREALVWRQLKHPNVLSFIGLSYSLFPRDSLPCLCAPWMANGTLKDYVKTTLYIPVQDIPRLLQEIASGLQYLHSLLVTHGDISHTNILIDDRRTAQLADFGLVLLEECTIGGATTTDTLLNKRWASPQRLNEMRREASDDIYSFACICYYLYSGDIPFHGYPDLQAMMRIIKGDRPARPTFESSLCVLQPSDTIWNLITRCWDDIPNSRPTMAEVLDRLKAANPESYTEELKLAIEIRDLIKIRDLAKQADVRVEAQGAFLSALQLVAFMGDLPLVQILLNEGADLDVQGGEYGPAIVAAARNKKDDIVALLQQSGANIYLTDKHGFTALHYAARNGLDSTNALLDNGAPPNCAANDGLQPLHLASAGGHHAIVSRLLHSGADRLAQTNLDWTALHYAAANGHSKTVRTILGNLDDKSTLGLLRMQTKNGLIPLHYAVKNRHDTTVQLLLKRHFSQLPECEPSVFTPLDLAACEGLESLAQFVLARGAYANEAYTDSSTPLRSAAKNGHEPIVRLLLEHGVNPNGADNDGVTPLHFAAKYGHVPIVQLLLDCGVDPTAADILKRTPLYSAAQNDHEPIVRLLVDYGVDPHAADTLGWTPLHFAAHNGHEPIMRLLLDHGVDPNVADNDGWTPLQSAAENGHESIVRLLLDCGVDPNAVNIHGTAPLHTAAQNGHESVVQLLLDRSNDPNALNISCGALLQSAAENGREPIVRLLLDRGVDPSATDNHGETPLHFAVRHGHEPVVRLLLERGANPKSTTNRGFTPLDIVVRSRTRHPSIEPLLRHYMNRD